MGNPSDLADLFTPGVAFGDGCAKTGPAQDDEKRSAPIRASRMMLGQCLATSWLPDSS
jgi:hypothetical protein